MTSTVWRRTGIVIARALAAAIALCAFAVSADAKDKDAKDSREQQPFIAETHVIAPERVGEFVLEGRQRFDNNDKFGGVAFRYQHPDYPQLRIDLFVYPIGEREADALLDSGMRDFLASMRPAVEAGMYRDVKETDTIEFDIDLSDDATKTEKTASKTKPPSEGKRGTSPEKGADSGNAKDSEIEALFTRMSASSHHIDGRRMTLSYDYHSDASNEWFPMRSRTYLFYRHLHYFKGRISAAASQIDEANFAAFTDRAMRELVPAVQAFNIGACANATIYVNTDAPEEQAADQLMRSFAETTARLARINCHSPDEKETLTDLGRDAAVETFVYSSDDWTAK